MTAICVYSNVYLENVAMLSLRMNIPILQKLEPNHTIIVFGAALESKQLLEFALKNPVKYIILNGENITSKYYDKEDEQGKYYIFLQKKFPTFQYSQYTADWLEKNHNIKCAGLYDFEFMNRTNISSTHSNPIDLLFYGFPNQEREGVEALLKQKYPTKNIHFAWCVYNNDLVDLLVRSKNVINIPYFKDSALEIHRINQALHAGCKVFSKKSACNYLNQKYKSKITFVKEWDHIEL